MKHIRDLTKQIGLGLPLLLSVSTVALAQNTSTPSVTETSPAASSAGASEASPALEEIIITSQRRTENVQHSAVPVDVTSGFAMTSAGILSPSQLQQISPSINSTSSGGGNLNLFVRGVGNFLSNASVDPALAFNFDGVDIGRATGLDGIFYDLQRVEVVKGPQGTLYGRNATAGALNVIPNIPQLDEFSGDIVAGYGNYNAINVQADINIPLAATGAVRIAGSSASHDGYSSDRTGGEGVKAIRGQVLEKIGDDLSIRLDADFARIHDRGDAGYYADKYTLNSATGTYTAIPTGLGPTDGNLTPKGQAFIESQQAVKSFVPGGGATNFGPLPEQSYERNNFYGILADIEYKSPIGTLTIIPAYRGLDYDELWSSPGFTPWTRDYFSQTSVEARLGGSTEVFDYIAGFYYYDEKVHANETIDQESLSTYQDYNTGTTSYAGFGRLTWKVTDKFRLTGGLRYTDDQKYYKGTNDTYNLLGCITPTCPAAPLIPLTANPAQLPFPLPNLATLGPFGPGTELLPAGAGGAPSSLVVLQRTLQSVNDTTETHKITHHIAAEYDLAPNSLLYASVENGYNGGGFSAVVGEEQFKPETITAYTIGSKNELLDNRLRLNVEAYYWDYKDQQVAHFGETADGLNFFTSNVGGSTLEGFEVDSAFKATPTTRLSASVDYLDSKFDSFQYTSAYFGPPNVGCPAVLVGPSGTPGANTYSINCSGKPAYQAPKWTIALGIQQSFSLGPNTLELEVNTLYRDHRYIAFEYLPAERAPSVWTSNVSATLTLSNGWSIEGYVRNIEGTRNPDAATLFNSWLAVRDEPPRTFGFRFMGQF